MRREVWRLLIASKQFYVKTFRFAETMLIFSLGLSVLLALALCYAYLHIPERHYYVTNGEVPPTELTVLDAPNNTSEPLLEADPDTSDDEKLIPK